MIDAKTFELGEVIAEGAGLGRAASSARNHIPSIRVVDAGLSSSGIGVNDGRPRRAARSTHGVSRCWIAGQLGASTMLAIVMRRVR